MHLIMILAALGLTWFLRLVCKDSTGVGTAIHARYSVSPAATDNDGLAVLCMGPQGQMIGLRAGWFSYLLGFRSCRMPQTSVVGMALCAPGSHLSAARPWVKGRDTFI